MAAVPAKLVTRVIADATEATAVRRPPVTEVATLGEIQTVADGREGCESAPTLAEVRAVLGETREAAPPVAPRLWAVAVMLGAAGEVVPRAREVGSLTFTTGQNLLVRGLVILVAAPHAGEAALLTGAAVVACAVTPDRVERRGARLSAVEPVGVGVRPLVETARTMLVPHGSRGAEVADVQATGEEAVNLWPVVARRVPLPDLQIAVVPTGGVQSGASPTAGETEVHVEGAASLEEYPLVPRVRLLTATTVPLVAPEAEMIAEVLLLLNTTAVDSVPRARSAPKRRSRSGGGHRVGRCAHWPANAACGSYCGYASERCYTSWRSCDSC